MLLDEPYPPNLAVVPACRECNGEVSADEEYVACLVECTVSRSASADDVGREKIKRILSKKPTLGRRLADACTRIGGVTRFEVEAERVRSVALKLARGHAFFELNEPQHREPSKLMFAPLLSLSTEDRDAFERAPARVLWPEVGSRGMQRLALSDARTTQWLTVQPGRYRYLAYVGDSVIVRIVLSEFLACEVVWTDVWQAPKRRYETFGVVAPERV
ncbi:MAG TPA: hypothetical protein VGV87_06980 [Blastocatellia bacterium]|nr:hypothetical protein [Blastocatellia bacterium]